MAETHVDRVKDAAAEAESTADELEERGDRVGEGIEHAKKQWEDAKNSEKVPTASGDWEDSEPDDSTGEDPSGFDDPESLEDEDDDDDVDDE